jgi:hypothetical protein
LTSTSLFSPSGVLWPSFANQTFLNGLAYHNRWF